MPQTIVVATTGPIETDLPVVRGAAGAAAAIALDLSAAPLAAGEIVALCVRDLDRLLVSRGTIDGTLSLVDSVATWTPTCAETRAVRSGRVATYRFERRSDTAASVLAYGHLIGLDL